MLGSLSVLATASQLVVENTWPSVVLASQQVVFLPNLAVPQHPGNILQQVVLTSMRSGMTYCIMHSTANVVV